MTDAKGAPPAIRGLQEVEAAAKKSRGLPPVEKWNPDFCGDIDMRIARDGTWYYMGSPIGRPAMVRLFSSVLRKDADGKTYLVTPVEKLGITVDDAHFVAVAMRREGEGRGQTLIFTTHVGDEVAAGPDHPIRVERNVESGEPTPYIHVRGRLEALIARAVYYDLVALGHEEEHDGERRFGVWSGGVFFPLASAAETAAARDA
jgi:hypothetical protein